MAFVGGNQSSGSAAFATASKADSFFHDSAAQICINQALRHFCHCCTQCLIGEVGFTHPARKVSRLENSIYAYIVPLSGIFLGGVCSYPQRLHQPPFDWVECVRTTQRWCWVTLCIPYFLHRTPHETA